MSGHVDKGEHTGSPLPTQGVISEDPIGASDYADMIHGIDLRNFDVLTGKMEFACKCGCGLNVPHPELLKRLDSARANTVVRFVITSGCRCSKHNKDVGGKVTSSHLPEEENDFMCAAVDIRIMNSTERLLIVKALILAGFTRIGIGKTFVHADVDKGKIQNVIWLY